MNNPILTSQPTLDQMFLKKTLDHLHHFLLFSMLNCIADYMTNGEPEDAKKFKNKFLNAWLDCVKETNQIELDSINEWLKLHGDEAIAAAQIAQQPYLSTEDYQSKYNNAIKEVQKIFCSCADLNKK